MTDYKKLVNNTFTDGIIKMNEADPAHELDALSTGLQQLKQTMINNYEPNKMKNQNEFNAICLLQLDNILTEDAELIRVKARIPEVHSLLPIPDHKGDYNKISLYPTFIGIVGDLSVSPTTQAIPVGTELSVTFDNTTNFGGPKIVRVLKMSPADDEGGTGLSTASRTKKLGRGKVEDTPKEMVKIDNIPDKLILRTSYGTIYGTKEMKDYLYSLPTSLGKIYAADVSDAAGSRRKGDAATPTFGGPLSPHKSHQSGIDVDLPLFLKGDDIHQYYEGVKAFHNKARKLLDKGKTVNPNVILEPLDVQRTFDFLVHSILYAKKIILHPAIVKYLEDKASTVKDHSDDKKKEVIAFIKKHQDRAGLSGLGHQKKIKNKKNGKTKTEQVRAHSDHFHVRLNSRGYDDPAGAGRIWANYSTAERKKWTDAPHAYTPLWSKKGTGKGATYVEYKPEKTSTE